MAKGKQGLYDLIKDCIDSEGDGGISSYTSEVIRKRDMGGEHLIVRYLNDDGEWESYLVTAERVN